MKTLSHLIALLSLPLAITAQAQTVYRCGNSYSQQPCPDGNAVRAEDSRTPQQQKAAQDGTKHERRVADTLEKQRVREEESAARTSQEIEKAERAAADKRAAQKAAEEKSRSEKNVRGGRHKEPRYFTARDASGHKPAKKDAAR